MRRANRPVVANVDAEPHREAEQWAGLLGAQLTSPVRWRQTLHSLETAGANVFLELGPGTVLTGLVKRTLKGATKLSVARPGDVDSLLDNLSHATESGAVADGELLYAIERLIVSPATGVFEPLAGLDAGAPVEQGQMVGSVGSTEVRSPFAGSLQGLLALAGERVNTSQPLAWLRGLHRRQHLIIPLLPPAVFPRPPAHLHPAPHHDHERIQTMSQRTSRDRHPGTPPNPMGGPWGIKITGVGAAMPDKVLTNDDLTAWMDTSDEWIRERTGIGERRIGGSTSGLSTEGGQDRTGRRGGRAGRHRSGDPGHHQPRSRLPRDRARRRPRARHQLRRLRPPGRLLGLGLWPGGGQRFHHPGHGAHPRDRGRDPRPHHRLPRSRHRHPVRQRRRGHRRRT